METETCDVFQSVIMKLYAGCKSTTSEGCSAVSVVCCARGGGASVGARRCAGAGSETGPCVTTIQLQCRLCG